MSTKSKISLLAVVFALVIGISASPAAAAGSTFDLTVKHAINGEDLGLDQALPVDVYVNGGYAFTFSFGEKVNTSLPAGSYFIEVNLAGTSTTVMTLGPADIPADVDVTIKAFLQNGSPTLKAKVN
ncbi:MAG: hypothetical protein R3335_10825 [Anaerolineales bacterium]|nr:hypothetical protein [Anaerolineales bacterium]